MVDDGSGEEYKQVFDRIGDICIVLRHAENLGKGAAIKTALSYIKRELWDNKLIGIMDCDGQHLPEDMQKLFQYAMAHRKALVLGVRTVGKEMPLKSRLGNQITRGIYRLVSGVEVSDTQTGLRAFDLELAEKFLSVEGERYEYEMNYNGTIIRNGVVYRNRPTDVETCVLNWDGTMDIYGPDEIDLQQLIEKGAYQSWIFGPSLLDENGKAKESFLTWNYIKESHPRTAIGYYEPGHYCLMLVDGRQKSSRGMFPDEMAKVFEELGCRAAYNLDGGHCSFMTFQDRMANHPYKPEHKVTDGIFITEGLG